MGVVNIVTVFTSVCGANSGKIVSRTFGRNAGTAPWLMRHSRFLKTAALFLIGSSALTSVALFPAPDTGRSKFSLSFQSLNLSQKNAHPSVTFASTKRKDWQVINLYPLCM